MKTSVIITIYNRHPLLKACLRALALNSGGFDEAVVSDDGSDPESVRAMEAFFPDFSFPVRFVRQEHRGFRAAAARNNGVRAAAGEYLVLIDCDILLLPGTLDAHLRNARQGRFLAGNRALLNEATSSLALEGPMTPESMDDLWRQSDRQHLGPVHRQFERNRILRRLKLTRRHKPKILGCHFSIFREDIEKINGFDEQYTGWGFEDDDLSMRLHMVGVRGRSVIQEARALHLWHEPVASKPDRLSESANKRYFRRRRVTAFCFNGLKG